MLVKCRRAIVDRSFFCRHGGEVSPPRNSPLAKPAENNSARDFAAIVFFGFRCARVLSYHDIFKVMASWRPCFKRSDGVRSFVAPETRRHFCPLRGIEKNCRRNAVATNAISGARVRLVEDLNAVGGWWHACTAAWWRAKSVPSNSWIARRSAHRPASAWQMRCRRECGCKSQLTLARREYFLTIRPTDRCVSLVPR